MDASRRQETDRIRVLDVVTTAGNSSDEPAVGDIFAVSDSVGLRGKLTLWRQLRRRIASYDVVHLRYNADHPELILTPIAALLARFFGAHVVLSCNGISPESRERLKGATLKTLLRLADVVIVRTPRSAQLIAPFHGAVEVIPRAMSDRLEPAEVVLDIQPRILAVPVDDQFHLSCLVRGFSLVKQKYPRAELVLAAAESQVPVIRKTLRDRACSAIELTAISNLPELIRNCDTFVDLSLGTDPSGALIDSLALGHPVIALDTSAAAMLIHHGIDGIITPSGDHVALADRMIDLIEDRQLVEKLSRNGRKLARQFDRSAISARYSGLFVSIVPHADACLHRSELAPQYQTSVKA